MPKGRIVNYVYLIYDLYKEVREMNRSVMAGKRILTAVLSAGMVLTMLPAQAVYAAEPTVAAEQTIEAVAEQAIEAPATEQTAEAAELADATEQTAEAAEPAPAEDETTETVAEEQPVVIPPAVKAVQTAAAAEPAPAAEQTIETAAEEEESQFNDGHTHCVCGSNTSCGNAHNTSQVWTAWDSPTALPTEVNAGEGKGYYYLTQNVSLDNDYTADDGLFLCLNGHTVTMNEHSYICDGTLTITNCAAKNGSGVRPGGFVQGAASYLNDYMIKARNLNLYHVSLTATGVKDTYYLTGYDAASGEDLPDYHIEDSVFTFSSEDRDASAAVRLAAANTVTIKDTQMTGSSDYLVTSGVKVEDLKGRLVMSGTDIVLNTEAGYDSWYFGTYTYPLTICSSADAEVKHQIDDCTIRITDTYSGNSATICAASLTGTGEYDLTNCTISASATGTGDCTGLSLGSSSTAVLDGCTVTATNVTENGNGTVYAVYKEGSLSLLNGSAVTATTRRSAYAYGMLSRSSGAAHTLDVVDSAVTGREFGIYLNTTNRAGAQTVNIEDSEITATFPDPYINSGTYKGVGIYHAPNSNDYDTIYLGGETDVTGASFSINAGRPSTDSSPVDHFMPKLYAKSKNGTALSADGEAINLYCDYSKNNILTGDQIILDGMSASLADKIKLIYPDTCYLGTDGEQGSQASCKF